MVISGSPTFVAILFVVLMLIVFWRAVLVLALALFVTFVLFILVSVVVDLGQGSHAGSSSTWVAPSGLPGV